MRLATRERKWGTQYTQFFVLFYKKCNFEKKKYFSNKKAEINLRHFSKTLGLLSEEKNFDF